jgi:ankyrin repeat protein
VNKQNNDGQTALMLATGRGQQAVMKTLLEANADQAIVDDLRSVASSYAQDEEGREFIKKYSNKGRFNKLRTLMKSVALSEVAEEADPNSLESSHNLDNLLKLQEKLIVRMEEETEYQKNDTRHQLAAVRELHSNLTRQIADSLASNDRSLRGHDLIGM